MKHLISVPSNTIPHFHQISGLSPDDWFVSSDPEGKKVGSGGGTAHLLTELFYQDGDKGFDQWLGKEKRVIIHAGGQSRRLPAYAALGKSLLPMPVFRWSRGQSLNQRLIHLQAPLFDQILENAPKKLNTLIASGDTLIFSGKCIPKIPEADMVCFGMWLEPEKATNHGVFFANHEDPGKLQFMLQKPTIQKIKELIHEYYFLMDIGIWLLSDKAINLLMKRCGWKDETYENKTSDFYDLYSNFGMAMGESPIEADEDINKLKVALVNLEEGEFYHLGNTSELISSNLAIQNRITDQREIWHRQIKPHPSIFILNAEVHSVLTTKQTNLWIENSIIPSGWELAGDHVLTHIPENSWSLKLPSGTCLDLPPVSENEVAIRNYGFEDTFRGERSDNGTRFMGSVLSEWLKKRDLSGAFSDKEMKTDMQFLPLFPVVKKNEIAATFIQWLIDEKPEKRADFTNQWLGARRLSSDEISWVCHIPFLEEQSKHLRSKAIPALAVNYTNSVFYQLDLAKLANDFVNQNLELPATLPGKNMDWLPLHFHMFRASVLRKRGLEWNQEEKKAFDYLRNSVLEHFHEHPVEPVIKLLPDQIAWGRSPVRLDLAGGWTDTPPYCFLHGGKVVNLAVELNGQPPLHCYIKASEKPEFVIRSIDLGAQETIRTFDELRAFHNIGSPFAIPKAALALAGFIPEFSIRKFPSLEKQLEYTGGGMEISILSAVPKGSGLGTSSILAATVLGTISEVCGLKWDKTETGRRTLALEQLLTTGGGWQDQFGGILEGIKLLETSPGKLQSPLIKWLPESLFTDPVNKNRMLLYYTGITRVAKSILAEIVRGMFLNSSPHLALLEELKVHAGNTSESLLSKDFEGLGKNILRSWHLNQTLDHGTNTTEIQKIIDRIALWTVGYKLLGAGGGGFMLIFAHDEKSAGKIRHELTANPVNNRARLVDFSLSTSGLQVTKS
ncbi:MAG TPA: bifunctional fucokinase/L-fucose-1-P-guanylyltransferase [Prolixibacteraceae bacterium]|nr:bifunctional fucokinase/L-fucose-1-P-guanylyltransferase [Prolixibacteraceae bacterium]